LNCQFAAGSNHTKSDFAPIGDQDLFEQ
jgi:hypothetical protein